MSVLRFERGRERERHERRAGDRARRERVRGEHPFGPERPLERKVWRWQSEERDGVCDRMFAHCYQWVSSHARYNLGTTDT